MAGFQRRDDAFEVTAVVEGAQSLVVVDRHVVGAANVLQMTVLGPTPG